MVREPGALSGPRSRECGQFGTHEICAGFAGDYDTYICGCACHWCPRGEHKRGDCDCRTEGQLTLKPE